MSEQDRRFSEFDSGPGWPPPFSLRRQLNDRIEPLENVLGSDARHLSHQLAEASSPLGMARLMDTVLRPLNPPDTAQNALQELSIDDGTIEQVASAAALSTRQLRRLCMERAGVSPKYLRRILRFEKQFKGSRSSARTRAGRIGRISLRCADTTIRLTSFENFKSSPVTHLADIYNPDHSRSLYPCNHEPSTTREPDRLR